MVLPSGRYEMAGDRVRYICPICDHEMKFGRHYCWNCKSRVDEPWRYTGGHLPNEGHEGGCHPAQTYMQPRRSAGTQQSRTHGGRSLAGKNNTSKQYTYNRPGQTAGTSRPAGGGSRPSYGNTNTPRPKNTGCGTLIIVLFVFWFIMQVILSIFLRF